MDRKLNFINATKICIILMFEIGIVKSYSKTKLSRYADNNIFADSVVRRVVC